MCRVYVHAYAHRCPFSSFESDSYPAPGSRSYIFRETAVRNKQQATTLLHVTPLILTWPSPPLVLLLTAENRNSKRMVPLSQSSDCTSPSRRARRKQGSRVRSAILPRVSHTVLSLRRTVVLFERNELIAGSSAACACIWSI